MPDVPQDQVASQSPTANASGISAPKIDLLVSLGPETAAYVMPSFVGQLLGSTTSAVQDAGFKVGHVGLIAQPLPNTATPSTPNAASVIVNQTPARGRNSGRQRRKF